MIKKFYRWNMDLPSEDNGYKFDAKIFDVELDIDSEYYRCLKDNHLIFETYENAKDSLKYSMTIVIQDKYKQIKKLEKEKDIIISNFSRFD